MTVEAVPRSLADALRGWDDPELVELLRARPDLLSPVPTDVAALAARAGSVPSVSRILDRLDRFALDVLEAMAVLPEPLSAGAVVHALPGRAPAGGRGRRDAVSRAGPRLRAGRRPPARRARSSRPWGRRPPGLVRRWPPRTSGSSALAADPDRLDALLAEAPDGAREALDHLVWGPPHGRLENARRPLTDPAAARTPCRVAARQRAARGRRPGHRRPPSRGRAPPARRGGPPRQPARSRRRSSPPSVDPAQVDRVRRGAGVHGRTPGRDPARVLGPRTASCPAGRRPRRPRAPPRRHDPRRRRAHGRSRHRDGARSRAAGRRRRARRAFAPDPVLRPVAHPRHRRPVGHPHRGVAGLDPGRRRRRQPRRARQGGRRRSAPTSSARRRRTSGTPCSAELRALPVGAAPDLASLVERLDWARPRRGGRRRAELVALDVRGGRAPRRHRARAPSPRRPARCSPATPTRRVRLLAPPLPDAARPGRSCRPTSPPSRPGPLESALARELALLADVESTGGATVFRFSRESVRRALDAGRDSRRPARAARALVAHPGPAAARRYLVDDVARRHGQIRVGGGVVLRPLRRRGGAQRAARRPSRRGAAAAPARADRGGSRRRRSTRCSTGLREHGLRARRRGVRRRRRRAPPRRRGAPARASARRGSPPSRRSPATRCWPPPCARSAPASGRSAGALGGRTVDEPPLGGRPSPRSTTAETLTTLKDAVDVGPAAVDRLRRHPRRRQRAGRRPGAGRRRLLTAFDHRAGEVRTFAVHRITGVAELDDDPGDNAGSGSSGRPTHHRKAPRDRRPADRPVRQDPAARGRPRARRRVPPRHRAVRRARARPRARPHLPDHARSACGTRAPPATTPSRSSTRC